MADWIIVADEEESGRKELSEILTNAGMEVTAVESGKVLVEYVRQNGFPDAILLDVRVPESEGFETVRLLKKEMSHGVEVPVILLTPEEDQNAEQKALEAGAMDYIHTPVSPDLLVSRIRKLIEIRNKMLKFVKEAETDALTGFLNKTMTDQRMTLLCEKEDGLLCILDLDSFKSINDIFGHDIGDQVLVMFSEIVHRHKHDGGCCGRIGGDEFILFDPSMHTEEDLHAYSSMIGSEFETGARELMGENLLIPVGVSIGAVAVPDYGRDYKKLFHMADQALYFVKQNGKHGSRLYRHKENDQDLMGHDMTLEMITAIMEERNEFPNAMWMGREVFGSIYRYMVRYMDRYHSMAYRVLFTVKVKPGVSELERAEIMTQFRKMMQYSLRNSDVMMECGENQLFLLLPEVQEYDIDGVIHRLLKKWKNSAYADLAEVRSENGPVHMRRERDSSGDGDSVVVLTDPETAEGIADLLIHHSLRPLFVQNEAELFDLLRNEKPDLILLDQEMDGRDGLTVLKALRRDMPPGQETPVIMLHRGISPEFEKTCMMMGAADAVMKPVVPEVFMQRVRHAIEFMHLQRNFGSSVERKTKENNLILTDVIRVLAEELDRKGQYYSGHSNRVAEYAREIAARAGYSRIRQDEVYLTGLLHDIGTVGIPTEILTKKGPLSEEEFEIIKSHSAVGAEILSGIRLDSEIPSAVRAHHEHFDGSGYPDGLSGEAIPETARILAVADAYDAMSSHRSYRKDLSQEEIRRELIRCSGSQFDPRFADIMLAMMEEDPDFSMREK